MKVLILGGTGALGTSLSDCLCEKGYEVHISSRTFHEDGKNKKYHLGNARDLIFLRDLLKLNKFDAIVDFMVYGIDEFNDRMECLLDATEQYIYVSSARVYSNPHEGIINENTPRLIDVIKDKNYLGSGEDYALKKAMQENSLLQSKKNNYTIVRPYISYSDYRLQLGVLEKEKWLSRAVQGNTIVLTEDILKHKTTLTYAKDVSLRMASLVGLPQAKKEIYNIASNQSVSWQEILDIYLSAIGEYLGEKVKVLLLTDTERFFKIMDYRYAYKYDRLFDRKFDCAKINEVFGSNQYMDVRIGLKKCIDKFMEAPLFEEIPIFWTAYCDRLCRENTKIDFFKSKKRKIKYLICRWSPYMDFKLR